MPNAADGSVVIDVGMNISDAEKQLTKLKQRIGNAEKELEELTKKRDESKESGAFQAGVLDAEKAKLEEIKDRLQELKKYSTNKGFDNDTRRGFKDMLPGVQNELSEQRERVRMLQAEFNKTEAAAKKYDDQIMNATSKLETQKATAGALEDHIRQLETPAAKFGERIRETAYGVETLTNRIKGLAKRVFVFSMFTAAFRAMRKHLGEVVKTNDKASRAMAQLKAALLTMVQPLVDVIIPAFTVFLQVLTTVVTTIATLLASLFGTTVEQSAEAAKNLNSEKEALSGVGGAAKDASKSMASFDEINKLSSGSDSGGSGASTTDIQPDFTFLDAMSESLKARLEEISEIVTWIGLGFLAWKIGENLPGSLGQMASNLGLIMMAVGGIVLAWDGLTDAWENGVDWLNMAEMIGGVALAVWALNAVFGPLAANIALVAGGVALAVTGFRDMKENGMNLENTLLTIAGILGAGLGLSGLTHSKVPLFIAAIGAAGLAIAYFGGEGETMVEGLKLIFSGFAEFMDGVFTGDIEKIVNGIVNIFNGIELVINSVIDGAKNIILNFLNWLDEKTGGKFSTIIGEVKTMVSGLADGLKDIFSGIIKVLKGGFTNDWRTTWEGIKDIFAGIVKLIAAPWVAVVNVIIGAMNTLIRGLNKIKFKVPDWVPSIGGKSLGFNVQQIPKVAPPQLAEGAVIPPNREFLAVLGDQKTGTNIEAPVSEIEGAVARGIASAGGGNRDITVILQMDRREFGRAVYKANNEETQRVGVRLVGGRV